MVLFPIPGEHTWREKTWLHAAYNSDISCKGHKNKGFIYAPTLLRYVSYLP